MFPQDGRNLTFNFRVSPGRYVDARKGDEPGESAHSNDNSPKIPESQRLTRAPLVRYEGRAFIAFMSPWSPCALCSSRHPDVVRRVDGRMHPTWHGVLWRWTPCRLVDRGCPNVTLVFRVWFCRGVSYFGHLGPISGRSILFSKKHFHKNSFLLLLTKYLHKSIQSVQK